MEKKPFSPQTNLCIGKGKTFAAPQEGGAKGVSLGRRKVTQIATLIATTLHLRENFVSGKEARDRKKKGISKATRMFGSLSVGNCPKERTS